MLTRKEIVLITTPEIAQLDAILEKALHHENVVFNKQLSEKESDFIEKFRHEAKCVKFGCDNVTGK